MLNGHDWSSLPLAFAMWELTFLRVNTKVLPEDGATGQLLLLTEFISSVNHWCCCFGLLPNGLYWKSCCLSEPVDTRLRFVCACICQPPHAVSNVISFSKISAQHWSSLLFDTNGSFCIITSTFHGVHCLSVCGSHCSHQPNVSLNRDTAKYARPYLWQCIICLCCSTPQTTCFRLDYLSSLFGLCYSKIQIYWLNILHRMLKISSFIHKEYNYLVTYQRELTLIIKYCPYFISVWLDC